MTMFFNVKPVREHLIKHGHVYTLRKATRKAGKDTAFYGDRFKGELTKIGRIEIFIEMRAISPNQLEPYVNNSGMPSAEEWWKAAVKIHKGEPMNLYHVFLCVHSEVC